MAAYPLRLREQACDLVAAGWTQRRVATELGVSCGTIERWLRQWRQTGTLCIGASSGRPRRIGSADEPLLQAQLRAHPRVTLAEHGQLWEAAPGVRVSTATMCRSIQRLGWTRKRRPTGRLP